ncbi:hypothetical protein KKC52_03545 [bacterium]|nr:hypothetical protein [bacterium]
MSRKEDLIKKGIATARDEWGFVGRFDSVELMDPIRRGLRHIFRNYASFGSSTERKAESRNSKDVIVHHRDTETRRMILEKARTEQEQIIRAAFER